MCLHQFKRWCTYFNRRSLWIFRYLFCAWLFYISGLIFPVNSLHETWKKYIRVAKSTLEIKLYQFEIKFSYTYFRWLIFQLFSTTHFGLFYPISNLHRTWESYIHATKTYSSSIWYILSLTKFLVPHALALWIPEQYLLFSTQVGKI